jgi:hypothetical protein
MITKDRKFYALAAGAITLATASAANATFYTTEASFLAAISPSFYLEDFSSYTYGVPYAGNVTNVNYPEAGGTVNGYSWTVNIAGGVWSNPSALSTNTASDPINITFTGAPVKAFGGNFTNTDISGNNIPGVVTVNLSNGESQTLTNPTASSFLGWTGTVAITSIVVNASDPAGAFSWPQVDHFYIGTTGGATPCPANIVNTGTSAGKVDVDDLLAVISQWGPCPAPPATCPANIVNTGTSANKVDVDDLLAVISQWGPCPS